MDEKTNILKAVTNGIRDVLSDLVLYEDEDSIYSHAFRLISNIFSIVNDEKGPLALYSETLTELQDICLPAFEKAMLEDVYDRDDVAYRYTSLVDCVVKVMDMKLSHICSALSVRSFKSIKHVFKEIMKNPSRSEFIVKLSELFLDKYLDLYVFGGLSTIYMKGSIYTSYFSRGRKVDKREDDNGDDGDDIDKTPCKVHVLAIWEYIDDIGEGSAVFKPIALKYNKRAHMILKGKE